METFTNQSNRLQLFVERFKKEKVFFISLVLAVLSSLFLQPKISYVDLKVLVLLFNLMIIVAAFEELKVMDKLALEILKKCKDTRRISLVFIVITFFSSMLVTNDVALITFVPLAILTFKKVKIDSMKTIILQTLAANIGSSLTPMGNPQNLFLFTHYNLNGIQFFSVTIPFVLLGILWLYFLNKRVSNEELQLSLHTVTVKNRKKVKVYIFLFIFIIFSVFGLVNYKYTFLVIMLIILFMDRHLLKSVDYFLLATFVCFFIFIGNVSNVEFIQYHMKSFLQESGRVYFSSILLSQVVSNVPCSILLSGFTDNWREMLLGVNIGGMGTLVASLASVISYKIYANENEGKSRIYLSKFNLYSFVSLFIFTVVNYFYISTKY
ncbi:SLC13 family permease [Clostridium sp. A1-XYC3]|uniref:SLC13 family permease n=1 Tax=Clostridium tanneri TaxID=3037988 RepID=A0ABU4JW00_9CLOT|nr:SLC13 family permease [Clostridium sp. A1-XYC3]MDW8802327.1 SLC13 family permease [Clostridium sp. A1-XYC3]